MMIADRARPAVLTAPFWKKAGWIALAVTGASIAVLWSWNTLAGDLFALPQMQFRHALAAVLLGAVLGAVISFGARRRHAEPHP